MKQSVNFLIAVWLVLLVGVVPGVYAEQPSDSTSVVIYEPIGGLVYGMGRIAAFKQLGVKPALGEIGMSGMTGAYYQVADFTSLGVSLTLISYSETAPQEVDAISVVAPSTLKTQRGIHIGSSEADVIAAYKAEYSKDDSEAGARVVVGNIYAGALYFSIEHGKVVEISVASGQELN
ncbi:MAG TPA: hypothetical protein VN030_10105 [Cellvibrio sp.]|nr:hypothetical protein [Cellvibrio sp.]